MKRTQIYLSAELDAVLTRLSSASGVTKSHLIRDALEQAYLDSPRREHIVKALNGSAGAWRRRESGETYVERLRGGRLGRLHAAERDP